MGVMDLNKKDKLDTVTVFDLMNNNFYIPDYQRGYRWTEFEVKKMLNDLEDFFDRNTNGDSFYCLQPLVVFFNKEKNAWEVIDGQQRLTTLFLIINQGRDLLEQVYPDMKMFSITYQSRPGSEKYLLDLDETERNDNIDYYHLFNAAQVINDFLTKTTLGKWRFIDKIVNANNTDTNPSVKFIWYNVTEEIESNNISPEEKFSNLNIGKISLTNAELIKALFINSVGKDESEALRIASEWDCIEHSLQNDTFWSFIYGKEDGRYATRIEFLFDIIQNKQPSEKNEYYTFDKYSNEIKVKADELRRTNPEIVFPEKEIVKALWKAVSDKYYLYKGWFKNKKLYHMVGFLRYQKEKNTIEEIEAIYNSSLIEDIDDFFRVLKLMALACVTDNIQKVKKTFVEYEKKGEKDAFHAELEKIKSECLTDTDIRTLNYHITKDHKKIFAILTFFNILSIVECEKSDVRFSFDQFYKQSWDIEHIRSQTPKEIDGEGRLDWITCNIEYFSGIDYKHLEIDSDGHEKRKYQENRNLYISDVKSAGNRSVEIIPGYTVGDICDELLGLMSTKSDITESNVYNVLCKQIFKQDSTFKYDDSIGNLVLLDQGTNRGYKNAFYPVKRKWIYRREHGGIYILPCTRDAFAKNYSKTIYDLMNWNNEDAEAYMTEIERVIYNG